MRKLANDELDRLNPEAFREAEKTPVIILLDNVRSMNNVGSVFRTADAFLVTKIFLCGYTPQPPHRDIQKTALGATETVAWEHAPDTLTAVKKLQQEGWAVYAVEQAEQSIMLHQFVAPPQRKTALVFGNEVEGVQQEVVSACDGCIEIPQFGTKHSFNIAVAAGIVVWEVYNKLQAKDDTNAGS
jgi:tRNA G18 (ribose-2'-O)-methylase SpoU